MPDFVPNWTHGAARTRGPVATDSDPALLPILKDGPVLPSELVRTLRSRVGGLPLAVVAHSGTRREHDFLPPDLVRALAPEDVVWIVGSSATDFPETPRITVLDLARDFDRRVYRNLKCDLLLLSGRDDRDMETLQSFFLRTSCVIVPDGARSLRNLETLAHAAQMPLFRSSEGSLHPRHPAGAALSDPAVTFLREVVDRYGHHPRKRTLVANRFRTIRDNAPTPAGGWPEWAIRTAEAFRWPKWVAEAFAFLYVPARPKSELVEALIWRPLMPFVEEQTAIGGSHSHSYWDSEYYAATLPLGVHDVLVSVQSNVDDALSTSPFTSDQARLGLIAHVLKSFGWPKLACAGKELLAEAEKIPA